MSQEPLFGNWMVAIAEAAEVAGSVDLDTATAAQLAQAWELVARAADLSVEELVDRIAAEAGLSVADLSNVDPYAASLIPAELAWRRRAVPLRCTDRELVVATSDPLSYETGREISMLASREVTFEVATPFDVAASLEDLYGERPESDFGPSDHRERLSPGGPHVLVVDDEAGARALFRSILEEGGYRVTVAKDGPEAIGILEGASDFDLVLLDYLMDKMNGLRVLQLVRDNPSIGEVPVIMVTGASDRRIEMSLFEAGADDFIVKPIDAPLFLLRIQAVLRRRTLS